MTPEEFKSLQQQSYELRNKIEAYSGKLREIEYYQKIRKYAGDHFSLSLHADGEFRVVGDRINDEALQQRMVVEIAKTVLKLLDHKVQEAQLELELL